MTLIQQLLASQRPAVALLAAELLSYEHVIDSEWGSCQTREQIAADSSESQIAAFQLLAQLESELDR